LICVTPGFGLATFSTWPPPLGVVPDASAGPERFRTVELFRDRVQHTFVLGAKLCGIHYTLEELARFSRRLATAAG
jgi:hypothetical protein